MAEEMVGHVQPVMGDGAPTEFRKALGLFDSIMIVAGVMIGSGIFIVSAEISRQVGSAGWLLVAWAITGVLTVTGALSYGELAAMMPEAGGMYIYLREAFSPMLGFLYGWTMLTVIQTGTIAAVAIAFARFSGVLFPAVSEAHYLIAPVHVLPGYAVSLSTAQALALGVLVLAALVNSYGVNWGKLITNVFTVSKLVGMGLLLVLGAWAFTAHPGVLRGNFAHAWSPVDAVAIRGASAVTAFGMFVALCVSQTGSLFSADAWHNVTFVAGEVRDPKRNLPLALGIGTSLVVVFYILCNLCYLAALPLHGIQNAPSDRGGDAGSECGAAGNWRAGDGSADHGVDVWHGERDDDGGGAGVLRDGAGWAVLQAGGGAEQAAGAGVGAGVAMRVEHAAGAAADI